MKRHLYLVFGLAGLTLGSIAAVLHSWDLLLAGYTASGISTLVMWHLSRPPISPRPPSEELPVNSPTLDFSGPASRRHLRASRRRSRDSKDS